MSQPLTEWKVLPHGKLTTVEENILTVVGEIQCRSLTSRGA